MSSAQGQREYAPATRANSTRLVRTGRRGRTHVQLRTVAERIQAPPKMRFLIGLARPRRIVSSSGARFLPDLGLRTRVEHATNVNLRHEAMLDEFEAPHLGKRNRRCWNHQTRPEMMMRPAPARFFSRQPAEQPHGAIKSRRCSSTQTACPTERISPNASGAALQWRRYPPGGHLC